jgi:hypothetical protein
MHEKIAIFGYPRSGTKLLANVLEQQGYFNLGEFFNPYATKIENNPIRAVRTDRETQYQFDRLLNNNKAEFPYVISSKVKDRVDIFKEVNIPNTTVTIFSHCTELYPELFYILSDRYFLCTRRENELEHLLSRILTYRFKNYNNEVESQKITVNMDLFEWWFFQLKKLNRIQDYLVSEGKGCLVDFDKLISGSTDLGFAYEVTSVDQHKDLNGLIINYQEVSEKYEYLCDRCSLIWGAGTLGVTRL